MSFIENLELNDEQKKVFNMGYVNMPITDVLVLMDNMQEETFNKLYRHYYKKGVSYCKFEVLKKIYELSNTNLETLKEYAEMIGINENPVPEQEAPNPLTEPITTAELIRQLREGQE